VSCFTLWECKAQIDFNFSFMDTFSNEIVDHYDDAMWLGDSYVLSECFTDLG